VAIDFIVIVTSGGAAVRDAIVAIIIIIHCGFVWG
jgi:hypothetical protein